MTSKFELKGVKLPPFLVLIIRQDLIKIVATGNEFLESRLGSMGFGIGTEPSVLYKYFPRYKNFGTTDAPVMPPAPGFANPTENLEETQAVQTKPAVEEPLIPGRDAMIMRNLMRASMPESEPTLANPLPPTQQLGETVNAAITQPTENANPRVGETRLIQDPQGQGYVMQYFTGNKNLGWQSREALENYVRRSATLGATSQPTEIREVREEKPTQIAKEQPEKPTTSKQIPFGTRAVLNKKNVFYVSPEVGYVPQERFKEYAAGQQFRKDVGKAGQFLKSVLGNILSGVGQMGG